MTHKQLPTPFLDFEDLEKGLTGETVEAFKKNVADILRTPDMIYEQKRDALAAMADDSQPYPHFSAEARDLLQKGILCLLGKAPRLTTRATSRRITRICSGMAAHSWNWRPPKTCSRQPPAC